MEEEKEADVSKKDEYLTVPAKEEPEPQKEEEPQDDNVGDIPNNQPVNEEVEKAAAEENQE